MWKDNLRDGKGTCFYYTGELYVGEWKAGRRHGSGELFMRKGDRYNGEWRSDYMDGKGVYTSANGAKYTGRFKQDRKHGKGELVTEDKQHFEEMWQNGVLVSHKKKSVVADVGTGGVSKSVLTDSSLTRISEDSDREQSD